MVWNQRSAGALLSILLLIVNGILALLFVPLVLNHLSVSDYGVFELGTTMIAAMSMMDLGLSASLTRYYVHYESTNPSRLPDLLTSSVVIFGLMTVIAVGASTVFYFLIDSLFGREFTSQQLDTTRDIGLLLILNASLTIPLTWVTALLVARERFVFLKAMGIMRAVLQFTLVLTALALTSDIVIAILTQVILTGSLLSVSLWKGLKRTNVAPNFGKFRPKIAGQLLGFSSILAVTVIFDLVFWRSGQFILGAVSGASMIAVYAVTSRIVTSVFMPLSTSVSSVFLPKLTRMIANETRTEESNVIFIKIGRIQSSLIWPFIGCFFVLGDEAINFWIGEEFSEVYICTLMLICSLAVSSIQSLANSMLQASNLLGFRSIVLAIMLTIFIIVSVPVAKTWGAVGISALGSIILAVGTGPVMNLYYSRVLRLDIRLFFRSVAPFLVPVIAAIIVVGGVKQFLPRDLPLILAALGVLFIIVYTSLMWKLTLNSEERGLIIRLLRLKDKK